MQQTSSFRTQRSGDPEPVSVTASIDEHRFRVRLRRSGMTTIGALAALFLPWGATDAAASAGGVWRRAELADPGSLDPAKTTTSTEQHILDELLEGLVAWGPAGEIVPGVAERWDISADGLTYTFHLRPDARWSNGATVTADDFVFSMRRLMDPATGAPYASLLYTLKNGRAVNTGALPPERLGIAAPDAATCVITLEQPTPYFLQQLTHMTALPVYPPSVKRWGDGFARPGRYVGDGAFTLKSYRPDDRLVMAKNPRFHDAAHVALDGEIVLPITDRAAALRRFMAGEIDTTNQIPTDEVGFVRERLPRALRITPSLGTYYYAFDTRLPPFSDVRVRRALSMVVDRAFLARAIWGGTAAPLLGMVPPGIASYETPIQADWASLEPFVREDQARRLLAESGFGPGHPLRLTLRSDASETYEATAVAVAAMWKRLGVETTFVISDPLSFHAFLASGAPYDLARYSWFPDYDDAQNILFLAESGSELNVAHFHDAAYDALMRAAADERDAAMRAALLHRAEAILDEQQPYLPLLAYDAANLVSPELQGWQNNVLDIHLGRYLWKQRER